MIYLTLTAILYVICCRFFLYCNILGVEGIVPLLLSTLSSCFHHAFIVLSSLGFKLRAVTRDPSRDVYVIPRDRTESLWQNWIFADEGRGRYNSNSYCEFLLTILINLFVYK